MNDSRVPTSAFPPPVALDQVNQGVFTDAQRLAERVQAAVQRVLQALPKDYRSAAGMARFTHMERTVCQRLVSAVVASAVSPETLIKIPGPKALRALSAALKSEGITEAQALEAAIGPLEEFFARAGETQKGFSRLLERHGQRVAPIQLDAADLEHPGIMDAGFKRRFQMYQLAKDTLGCWSRVHVFVAVYAPSRVQEGMVDIARARGVVGRRCMPGGVPLIFSNFRVGTSDASGMHFTPMDPAPRLGGTGTDVLLTKFCSDPIPQMVIKTHGQRQTYIIDGPSPEDTVGLDLISADYSPAGRKYLPEWTGTIEEVLGMVSQPTQGLLMDVFYHRDLARDLMPGLDIQLPIANFEETRDDRWATRVSAGPALKLLGAGLGKAGSAMYPRQAELIAELFERFGHDPSDFVGYRCEEMYPEWRLGYRMFFERPGAAG